MLYNQPFGAGADAPYVNGNPATGVSGSIPPAAAFEQPQRELVNFITDGGITPSGADLRQAGKAVQAGRFNFGIDTGTANNLNVAISPIVTTLINGMRLWVFPAFANTAAVTITVNALNNPVLRGSGEAMRANDVVPGMPLMLQYDTAVASWKALNAPLTSAQRKSTFIKFTAPGAWSWTPPTGVYSATFWLWAGGGGGGWGASNGGVLAGDGAGSGGAGGSFQRIALAVRPGIAVTGSLGAGGAAGVSGTNGGTGGTSTAIVLGTTYTCGGGQGGTNAVAGIAQPQSATSPTPATGDIARPGDAGAGAISISTGSIGGAGGDAFWGGVGGQGGTGTATGGLVPGGGGAASAGGFAAGAGARGEIWVEF